MFVVTLRCHNYKGPSVNWTKEMTKEEIIDTMKDMKLNTENVDWTKPFVRHFYEFASFYRLTVTPIN